MSDLTRIISDCMCRSDGLEPDMRGTLVYDDNGELVDQREWYDACAGILVETLARHGYRIVRDGGAE